MHEKIGFRHADIHHKCAAITSLMVVVQYKIYFLFQDMQLHKYIWSICGLKIFLVQQTYHFVAKKLRLQTDPVIMSTLKFIFQYNRTSIIIFKKIKVTVLSQKVCVLSHYRVIFWLNVVILGGDISLKHFLSLLLCKPTDLSTPYLRSCLQQESVRCRVGQKDTKQLWLPTRAFRGWELNQLNTHTA